MESRIQDFVNPFDFYRQVMFCEYLHFSKSGPPFYRIIPRPQL
ncbi:MAG: hypothetical protein P8X79_13320 [Reinekea sp.]